MGGGGTDSISLCDSGHCARLPPPESNYAAAGFPNRKPWTHLESNRTEESVDLGAVSVPSFSRKSPLDFCDIIPILIAMPRKVRQLFSDLERAGFVNRGGKGSHRNLEHPKGFRVTISGQLGEDARHYQEKQTRKAIKDSQK